MVPPPNSFNPGALKSAKRFSARSNFLWDEGLVAGAVLKRGGSPLGAGLSHGTSEAASSTAVEEGCRLVLAGTFALAAALRGLARMGLLRFIWCPFPCPGHSLGLGQVNCRYAGVYVVPHTLPRALLGFRTGYYFIR